MRVKGEGGKDKLHELVLKHSGIKNSSDKPQRLMGVMQMIVVINKTGREKSFYKNNFATFTNVMMLFVRSLAPEDGVDIRKKAWSSFDPTVERRRSTNGRLLVDFHTMLKKHGAQQKEF